MSHSLPFESPGLHFEFLRQLFSATPSAERDRVGRKQGREERGLRVHVTHGERMGGVGWYGSITPPERDRLALGLDLLRESL